MKQKQKIILTNLSKQLGKKPIFKYNKTYIYSIRISGQDTIELSEIEYEICLKLAEKKTYFEIERELPFDNSLIKAAFSRLSLLKITQILNHYTKRELQVLEPFDEELVGIRPFPRVIVWNITNKCNLSCRHCIERYFRDQSEDVFLNKELIDRLFEEMNNNALERLQISGGEPLCSPYFIDILESSLNTDICIDVFTNATKITEIHHKMFKRYINLKPNLITFHISLDGDKESHNYLRRNSIAFQETVQNIKRIIAYGGKVNIESIVHRNNISILEDYIKVLLDLHIDYVYMHPMFQTAEKSLICEEELSPEERFKVFCIISKLKNRYKDKIDINYLDPYFPLIPYFFNEKMKIPLKEKEHEYEYPVNCGAGLDKMFINSAGEVYPCLMYDKMKRDYCGNILDGSLTALWKSDGMRFVRKPIYESMLKCAKCNYHNICFGKIKSCRRAIEMLTEDYMASVPACNMFFNKMQR